jgi:cephalosporin hydroxylase
MPTPEDPKDPHLIEQMGADAQMRRLSHDFLTRSVPFRYSYNFSWLGRPIIQYPQDIVAMQEIAWRVKPDAIIETGIAHGGSLIFYASMLQLIGGNGIVVGVDVEIREHNRIEIEQHPLASRIAMIEGSSTSEETLRRVKAALGARNRVLVCLDSFHTHDHVLEELRRYSPFVRAGSYLVVFDTSIEDIPSPSTNRPWGAGNSPKTAVRQFLRENRRFEIDPEYDSKLLITVAPEGYLRCVADPD